MTVMLRQIERMPRIFLGDHGFLPQYGSQLRRDEIVRRIRMALRNGITAVAAGDFHVTDAAIEAFDAERTVPIWARHLDVPLSINGDKIDINRALSMLRQTALKSFGTHLNNDLVMGPFFDKYAGIDAYGFTDCKRLQIDEDMLGKIVEEIRSRQPRLVTAGGDLLDFLIACERLDLVQSFVRICATAAHQVGAELHVCTYLGFAWESSFGQVADASEVDGFMLPANSLGAGMIPDREHVLRRVAHFGKCISAMHVLVFGRLPMETAIRDVLGWPNIQLAFVGASQDHHIRQLAEINKRLEADAAA